MQVQAVLEDDRKPWDMRIQFLKRLRGILKGGALDYEEFNTHVKGLEMSMLTSVKDLRSQVCREACITLRWAATEEAVLVYLPTYMYMYCIRMCLCGSVCRVSLNVCVCVCVFCAVTLLSM